MKQAVQQAKEAGLTCLPLEQKCKLVTRYEAAIAAGMQLIHQTLHLRSKKLGRRAQSKARNLLDWLSGI